MAGQLMTTCIDIIIDNFNSISIVYTGKLQSLKGKNEYKIHAARDELKENICVN